MDKATANPFLIVLLFVVRCLIPLVVMLAISYLLRKLGFIRESPPPPPGYNNENSYSGNDEGGLAHGKP
ncbi:MAG TPA: hypothetical protein VJL34_06390 [Anaerolineales bacterium]|nr:hypothetical protein [Anaerolineales bacterium]